jgi:hypothetical protein
MAIQNLYNRQLNTKYGLNGFLIVLVIVLIRFPYLLTGHGR